MENAMKDFDMAFRRAKFKSGSETVSVLELKNKQVAAEADISKIVLRSNGESEVLDLGGDRTSYNRASTKKLITGLSDENTFKDLSIDLKKQIAKENGISPSQMIKQRVEEVYQENPELRLAAEKIKHDITQSLPKASDLKAVATRLAQSLDPVALKMKAERFVSNVEKTADIDTEVPKEDTRDKKRRNRRP